MNYHQALQRLLWPSKVNMLSIFKISLDLCVLPFREHEDLEKGKCSGQGTEKPPHEHKPLTSSVEKRDF
jgi:hypothetical protein